MARGKRVLITREEFCRFSLTVAELGMQDKFEGVTLYLASIYFEGSHTYISWDKLTSLEILRMIAKGINVMFNTNFVIVEDK